MTTPVFPPLFTGCDRTGQGDPMDHACRQARDGCDAGLVVYDLGDDRLRAAIVFAPEEALRDAVVALPVCGVGFQNALGALAPPEVAVHLEWGGGIRINGATCGRLRMAAADKRPDAPVDWLVVGLDLRLWPQSGDTGLTPDETALYAEGCADVTPVALLEAWVRHTLVGINIWLDSGAGSVHRDWSALAHDLDQAAAAQGQSGRVVGIDERLGLLLQQGEKTTLIPLTDLLEETT